MQWPALRAGMLVVLWCMAWASAGAAMAGVPPLAEVLHRADQQKTSNHAQFMLDLEQLQAHRDGLSSAQRQLLDYLAAWQQAYAGHYEQSSRSLHALIEHATDAQLVMRAKAQLVHNLYLGRHYRDAYALAYQLMEQMPKVVDPVARVAVTSQVIQMLRSQKQFDLALTYARRMQAAYPSGRNGCMAAIYVSQILKRRDGLDSSSPIFRSTVETCLAAGQPVFANALRLDWADLMISEGHPDQALALLRKVAPSIRKTGYQFHIFELHAALANAYLHQGKLRQARSEALAGLKVTNTQDKNVVLQYTYEVLYKTAQKMGDDAAALGYYVKYMEQYKAATNQAKAQALAFQMVRQDVLAKQQKLARLNKQNKILQLQQSLDRKEAENSRLYILLLLLTLAFLALWGLRVKHSQVRFRRLAHHDSLTHTLMRNRFLELAGQSLAKLHKASGQACLMILDLDHFKAVNDSHGHMHGDTVLKQVSAVCVGHMRPQDILGRLGGEEFGILLPGCSSHQGQEIGERLCQALAATTIALGDTDQVVVTASVGLAHTNQAGWELGSLLRKADQALYQAKDAGRNQLYVFEEAGFPGPATAVDDGGHG